MRLGVDVRHDGHVGVAEVGSSDRLAEALASGGHERRVERARHREAHDPLRSEFLRLRRRLVDAVGGSGDDDLAGRVVVRDPDVGVGEVAGHDDLVVVEAEHGGHRARLVRGRRRASQLSASRHEADAFVETECAGRGERRVLAEAVAGAEARVDTDALHRVEHHQARHERRQLRVAGVFQFVGVGVAQQRRDVAAGDLGGLVDEFPALVFLPGAAHAGALRSLSGKRESEHDRRI